MMDFVNTLTNWLYLHPHLAGVITFFISLSESLAVVGLIIPGSVMMTTIGALIGSGMIPAWETIIWAILGAVAGDSASYWLGHHYHVQIKRFWPFRTHPHWLERGESFFLKHGGKSVFIARFLGPMRPIIPVVAGMLNMQPRRFLLANISSAIVWAPTYMVPGMLLGFASLELAPETLTRFIFIIIGILLGLWLTAWFLQHVGTILWGHVSKGLDKIWARWAHTKWLRPITIILQNPHCKAGHGQLTLGLFFSLTVVAFGIWCTSITQHGFAIYYNQTLWHFFRGLRHPLFEHVMLGITYLGEKIVWLPVIIIAFTWLLVKGYARAAWHWLGLAVITYGGVHLTKHLLISARPNGLVATLSGNSFPSGHVAIAVAFYGFLAVLFSQALSNTARKWIVYVSITLVALVASSRLYLGAHWFSDIIGGLLFGLIGLMMVTLSYYRQEVPKIPRLKLLGIILGSLVISWSGYFFIKAQVELRHYQPSWTSQKMAIDQWWKQNNTPVIYRTSRLNQPDEVLNIQWASKLSAIEAILRAEGWHKVPKTNLNEVINRIAAKDRHQQLPLLSNLYHDRAPSLVMVKKTDDEDLLVVLRLWHSGYTLYQPSLPLWYGSVSYNKLWHHALFRKHRIAFTNPGQPSLNILFNDLGNAMQYRWGSYTYPTDLTTLKTMADDKRVLFIKPKS